MKEFNLTYYDKHGKTFLARAITNYDYVLLDPETNEEQRLTRWTIVKKLGLVADKKNSRMKSKRFTKTPRHITGGNPV